MDRQLFNSVQEALTALFGPGVSVLRSSRAFGGDINDASRADLSDGRTVFVKRNASHPASFFLAEARGLEALAAAGKIRVPKVLAVGRENRGEIFLLLEYIESGRPGGGYWERFGRQLAELHMAEIPEVCRPGNRPEDGAPSGARISGGSPGEAGSDGPSRRTIPCMYGFPEDNVIGETPQVNTWKSSWLGFFRECRLEPQLRMASGYFDSGMRKAASSLLDHLDRWIEEPAFPSLLHGDLWGGNALCSAAGEPVLIDPAAYIGHFETDLAMTELFGGFPEAFYGAYHEVNPIPRGYRERRDLYQLYHLLNHLNLFGGSYYGSVCRVIRRLIR